ncbi:hypothetical protein D3C85_1355840 [compost metagenome]
MDSTLPSAKLMPPDSASQSARLEKKSPLNSPGRYRITIMPPSDMAITSQPMRLSRSCSSSQENSALHSGDR